LEFSNFLKIKFNYNYDVTYLSKIKQIKEIFDLNTSEKEVF
jgi:hypothetical protein